MNKNKDNFLSKGTFVVNFISNVAFFIVNTLISIWFVPYLIHHLGVAVYGLVPLAMMITSYFNLLTVGLNTAVGRYMTIALGEADHQEANRIFNSSFWATIVISIVIFVLGVFVSLFIGNWINIPPGYQYEVSLLFALTILALLITTIGSSFNIISYCRNRFDLQNIGNISGVLLRVFLVVILFKMFLPNLWQVGTGIAAAAIMTFIIAVAVCRYLLPDLRIDIKDFSFETLKRISKTGIWIFISQIGTILLVSIDLVVANKLFGAEQSGRYASVLQWSVLLRNFGLVVAGIFGPTIISYYAKDQIEELVNYSKKAVKFMGLLIALPVGLICGFSKALLHVWLGAGFESLALLMVILTGHLALNLAYLPLHNVSMATNNVKWPAVSQIIAGGLNLALAIILGKYFHLYGIALAGAIVFLIRNIIFTPLYAAHIIKKPLWVFVNEIILIFIISIFVAGLSWLISSVWEINSWTKLIFGGAVVTLFYILFTWAFILNKSEKNFIKEIMNKIPLRKNIGEKNVI